MPPHRTQAERTRTTRAALLAAARNLFADHGYAGTGREQIVERAGVTRGALYHHFGSKEGLFREVVEQLHEEVLSAVLNAAMQSTDPREELRFGCLAFLDACLDPAFSRIVLIDAPAVLGWEEWRATDSRHSLGVIKEALRQAMEMGSMKPMPVEPLAHLLLAA